MILQWNQNIIMYNVSWPSYLEGVLTVSNAFLRNSRFKCVPLELKCIYILEHVPNIFEKPKAIDLGSVFGLLLLQLCFQSKNCLWRNIAMPLHLVIIIYSAVHFFISFVLNLISPIRQFTYSILSIISSLGRYL